MNRRYRKTIIAGNWKMNKTPAETKEFIAQLKPHAARAKWCETVLCVPYIDLPAAVKAAKNTRVFIAAQKVKAALSCGLRPIVCVGESMAQREKNLTLDHVRMQIKTIFFGVDPKDVKKIVVAYEPIWAIGTGKTATAEQADEVGRAIRECIREIYGARHARSVTILYGGSMNPQNAGELLAMPDVDGGLIGGASLDWEKFVDVMESANQ